MSIVLQAGLALIAKGKLSGRFFSFLKLWQRKKTVERSKNTTPEKLHPFFRTKILHVYRFDLIWILILMSEIPQLTGNSLGNSIRTVLVCELSVRNRCPHWKLLDPIFMWYIQHFLIQPRILNKQALLRGSLFRVKPRKSSVEAPKPLVQKCKEIMVETRQHVRHQAPCLAWTGLSCWDDISWRNGRRILRDLPSDKAQCAPLRIHRCRAPNTVMLAAARCQLETDGRIENYPNLFSSHLVGRLSYGLLWVSWFLNNYDLPGLCQKFTGISPGAPWKGR